MGRKNGNSDYSNKNNYYESGKKTTKMKPMKRDKYKCWKDGDDY